MSYIPSHIWSRPDSWISTDACLSGGEGYFNGEYFHFDFSNVLISAGKHINQFKLFVLWKAVELCRECIERKNILIYCDNKPTVDVLHSGISRNPFSQACIRNICHFAALHDFQITAVHITGVSNRISDCLSRWNLDKSFQERFHELTAGTITKEVQVVNTGFIDFY